jgi:lipopolysaccharide transport system permease protein
MTLSVFSCLFILLGNTPTTAGVPYVVSVLCALLLWNFFSTVATQSAYSIQANGGLISKIYCPRLVFPACTVLVALVDLAVGLVILSGMMLYFRVAPGWAIVLLPLFVLMAAVAGLAVGLWIATLSIRHRDMRYMLPTILQMWFFASPVVYDVATLIPPWLRPVYSLNPMGGILEGFRWAMLNGSSFSWSMFAFSGPVLLALFVGGLYYFRRLEMMIADHL